MDEVHSYAGTARTEIRAELARQRISQRVLAERMGVNENYVWRRLRGLTPLSLDDLQAIARHLNVCALSLIKPRGDQP